MDLEWDVDGRSTRIESVEPSRFSEVNTEALALAILSGLKTCRSGQITINGEYGTCHHISRLQEYNGPGRHFYCVCCVVTGDGGRPTGEYHCDGTRRAAKD